MSNDSQRQAGSTPGPLQARRYVVLLAVLRLGDGAYAVPIRDEIGARTGRAPARGAVYATLERLESKRYLESWLGEPVAERGGRLLAAFRVDRARSDFGREIWLRARRLRA